MAECQIIAIRHRKICQGDLRNKITIQSRNIQVPTIGVDFGEKFKADKKAWAAIKTVDGIEDFGNTNMLSTMSHLIYIRFTTAIGADNWIEYKSKTYDILKVENIDERDEWLALYCNERGKSSQASNFS